MLRTLNRRILKTIIQSWGSLLVLLLLSSCHRSKAAHMTGVAPQVGFWDGSVAVVRLQPGTALLPSTTAVLEEEGAAAAGSNPCRSPQHDMVLLTHFQVDPSPLRAVAWCPPQVNPLSPPPLSARPPPPLPLSSSSPTVLLFLTHGLLGHG